MRATRPSPLTDGPQRLRLACLLAACAAMAAARAAIVMPPTDPAPAQAPGAAGDTGARPHSIQPQATPAPSNVDALTQRAQAGDAQSMLALGYHFYTHPSLPQASAQARKWWDAAARAGDARAMLALGYLLSSSGAGRGRDVAAAGQWLDQAVGMGLNRAVYLRSLLARSSNGPRARQQARQLLEQAARDGDVMALNDLGVERELAGDVRGATPLYEAAAQAGLDVARQNLSRVQGAQRDNDGESLKRLQVLADEGDADALLALAYRYHRGDGVQRDFARAIQYYQRAADAGSFKAREFLALIFSRNGGAPGGVDQAWMQELAARINAATQWNAARRAPALSRPTRVNDPLADLLQPLPQGSPPSAVR